MNQSIVCCAICALLVFQGDALHAEKYAAPAAKIGKWSFSMNDTGPDLKQISAARHKQLRGNLQEITRLIAAVPVMNPPKGFEVRFWGSMSAKDSFAVCRGENCPPSRPTAALAMMIGRYEESDGRLKAAFNKPATMDVSINNLAHLFSHLPVLHRDAAGVLLPEPVFAGERSGMPTFLNNGHAIAVLASSGRSFWLPVSRERYLQAAIAATAGESGLPAAQRREEVSLDSVVQGIRPLEIEESTTWTDPTAEKVWVERRRSPAGKKKESAGVLQARRQKLQAELEAMTPPQRQLPARVDLAQTAGGQSPALLPVDSSAGVAVVTPDFSYFSQDKPPEAIQLVVIQWKFDGPTCYDPERSDISALIHNRALLEIYKTMDWNRLRAKVTQTVL